MILLDNVALASAYANAKINGYQGDVEKFKSEYRKYYDEFMDTIDNTPAKVEIIKNPFR